MESIKDSYLDLHRHRQRLQDQLDALRKGLGAWRKWDSDYECLKENVCALETGDSGGLGRIRRDFTADVLTGKELDEIFRVGGLPRSRDEIVNILDHRLDYVARNVEALEGQTARLEEKLAKVDILISPEVGSKEEGDDVEGLEGDGEGLPFMDIVEELDEHDNVISYQLHRPGDVGPQIRETLAMAGVQVSLGDGDQASMLAGTDEKQSPETSEAAPREKEGGTIEDAMPKHAVEQKPPRPPENKVPRPPPASRDEPDKSAAESATFAEDAKDGPRPARPAKQPVSKTAKRIQDIMQAAKEQEAISTKRPVLPADESEEDAELRKEMLRYGVGEIGAVVAELEIEEGDSGGDDESDVCGTSEFEEEDDEEDEDRYGRNKQSFISDGYRQRMLELEKRLGVESRSARPKDTGSDGDEAAAKREGIGRIVVKPEEKAPSLEPIPSALAITTHSPGSGKADAATPGRKSVRFAPGLSAAPGSERAGGKISADKSVKEISFVDPLSDVVERAPRRGAARGGASKQPSRFRQARAARAADAGWGEGFVEVPPKGPLDAPVRFLDPGNESAPAPTGPRGKILSEGIVEKETVAPADGEEEVEITEQEVAEHYHQLRNKFIHRSGGFLKEDESAIQPLDGDEGASRPVSRFKAARMSRP